MRNVLRLGRAAACAIALTACAPIAIAPGTTRATDAAASAPEAAGADAPGIGDAVALRWAIGWWTNSGSRAQQLAAVGAWSTSRLTFELAGALDITSSGDCARIVDARIYRDQTGADITVTAVCAGRVVSSRVLDLRVVVRAGRSLVDEVR